MQRTDKNNYYLDIAEPVLERGTCLRRNFGAIIVKNDESCFHRIYRRAERASKTASTSEFASERKCRFREARDDELCRSVHAEANAVISASRDKMIRLHHVSCRPRGRKWGVGQQHELLLHVQAHDNKRRYRRGW